MVKIIEGEEKLEQFLRENTNKKVVTHITPFVAYANELQESDYSKVVTFENHFLVNFMEMNEPISEKQNV